MFIVDVDVKVNLPHLIFTYLRCIWLWER